MMLAELRELRLEVQRLNKLNAELMAKGEETSNPALHSGYLTPQVADGGLEQAVPTTPSSSEPPAAAVSGDARNGAGASGAPVGTAAHVGEHVSAAPPPELIIQEATMLSMRADAGAGVQGLVQGHGEDLSGLGAVQEGDEDHLGAALGVRERAAPRQTQPESLQGAAAAAVTGQGQWKAQPTQE